jgi:DNA-binding NarL/FixJ family response regulator
MNTDSRIRLLLVDDHTIVREGFAALLCLQPDFHVVGQAGTGQEAVRLYGALLPDVTLMDLNLPDIDGVAAIRAIRSEFPDACLAVLTTYDNDERILSAVRSGARTFLVKTTSPVDLYRTIRELAAGGRDPSWNLTRRALRPGGRVALSDREQAVLERMVSGDTNDGIALRLDVSVNTVKTHVRGILNKLQARTRTEAVARALELGIVERRANRRER